MKARRHRTRIYVVGAAFVLVATVLWARLIQVQYVDHNKYAALAIDQGIELREVPPVRGGIFDRNGRPLALSAQLCSIAIKPGEVKHPARVTAALQQSLGVSRREIQRKLRSRQRFVYVQRQCQLSEDDRHILSSLGGVVIQREPGRIYPYGTLAARVVGGVGVDNGGLWGAEVAFEQDLRGEPGVERVLKNGRYLEDRYYRFAQQEPRDGNHVYLTIDVDVQEIAENEVARAVRVNAAQAGTIIVMEVETGDVLALAEYPDIRARATPHPDSMWTIRSLSHIYEPGSTFKIVTAGGLIETNRVAVSDSFDAENGTADLGYGSFRDTHPHGMLTFAEAFSLSSNIIMAKASRELEADEFYRFVRLFGFGAKTGVRLFGESAGSVPPVDKWSLRTQSTMAFGQEVAVTPLQMLNAMAAIANDGEMMVPRFVLGVSDGNKKIKPADPVKVRRVVSRRTAAVLKEMCRSVVLDGTGTAASPGFLEVSGKTGTAQKATVGGYKHNKYVASFVGFAPHEKPKIACLVILDEPRWAARYGGDSAAPAFARVCRAIANTTSIFDAELAHDAIVADDDRARGAATPNFLRMERGAALEHARRIGANVLCQGESGRVVDQVPDPGVPMDHDEVVRLYVGDSEPVRGEVPDLRGLSIREARRIAARLGLRAGFVGTGRVREQSPAPGVAVARRTMRLYGEESNPSLAGSSR